MMRGAGLVFLALYVSALRLEHNPLALSYGGSRAARAVAAGPLWLGAAIGAGRIAEGVAALGWRPALAAAACGAVPPLAAIAFVVVLPALLGGSLLRALRVFNFLGAVHLLHGVLVWAFVGRVLLADCAFALDTARSASDWLLRFLRYTIID